MTAPAGIKPLGTTSKWVRMALVTGNGFGKTTFAATAPNALHLTTDPEGTLSAWSRGIGKGNDEWPIRNWEKVEGPDSLEEAYEYMREEGCRKYKWLIHDNVTEEQDLAMDRAMKIALGRPGAKQDRFTPDRPQYQRSQRAFMEFTKQFLALPINQIWTGHRVLMTPNVDEEDAEDFYTVNIQGKEGAIAERFLGYMNVIAFGEMKRVQEAGKRKVVRRYYFTHTGPYRGKDRFHALGNYKDDLDVPTMMGIIEAKLAGNRRPAKKTAVRRRAASAA